MDINALIREAAAFLDTSPLNYVSEEDAIRPELAGLRIYDEPIFAVGAADDPLFVELRSPGVVGPEAALPTDWLEDAKSVLSFFLPFSERVRHSNREELSRASDEWLHGRIEGQLALNGLGAHISALLRETGASAVYPSGDGGFHMIAPYASNWSERHVAYVCGLGTFGLSRGLITRKGVAGRFGSVVTSAELPVTVREYQGPFEYCTMCGKCQKNCPVQAIDLTRGVIDGKDQLTCGPFVQASHLPPHGPNQRVRYGCGKCQVGVPCETGIPPKRKQPAL